MSVFTRETRSRPSSLRSALGLTWDLNVRAIPTSLLWALSLTVIFQSSNVGIRLACVILCSTISLFNTSLVKFSVPRIKAMQLVKSNEFRKILLLNNFVGLLFVLSLNNVMTFDSPNKALTLVIFSTAPTLFIAWMFVMLILNPIFVMKVARQIPDETTVLLLQYVGTRKKEIVIAASMLVISVPLFFFFISTALTLTQALTVISFEALISQEENEARVINE
jgi:hypothetical protein